MSDHDTALAELDRLGRQAAAALRAAAQEVTAEATPFTGADLSRDAEPTGNAGNTGATDLTRHADLTGDADRPPAELVTTADLDDRSNGVRRPVGATAGADADADPALIELPLTGDGRHGAGRTPARGRRVVLAAAAVSALIGLGVVNVLRQDDTTSLTESTVGAPSAAFGEGSAGIYPPDAERRGREVASPEGTEVWDQWQLTVTDAGQHLLLDLQREGTTVTSVLGDVGSEPLQVARVDAADSLPGAEEVALFGTVENTVAGTGMGGGTVTVERPGAEPVEMYVEGIDEATHNAFVGFVPGDLGPDATVVARGPDGQEISRVPVPLPAADGGEGTGHEGSIFPDDPDHATVQVSGGTADLSWGGRVLGGGRYVQLGASGNEDSVTTMIDRPASHALQVLATRLDGHPETAVAAVYGLVDSDAVAVELTAPGDDPVPLELKPIEGATHQMFGGIVPPDVDQGAVVVARDADGREIGRRPLAWTRFDAAQPGR